MDGSILKNADISTAAAIDISYFCLTVAIRTTMEISEITFSFLCYPWYWLTSHRTLLVYVLKYVLFVYAYLATLCIVLCKCQSAIPNKTTATIAHDLFA